MSNFQKAVMANLYWVFVKSLEKFGNSAELRGKIASLTLPSRRKVKVEIRSHVSKKLKFAQQKFYFMKICSIKTTRKLMKHRT